MHSVLDGESSPYLGRPWRAVRCVLISHSSKMNLPSTKYFPCMALSTEAESAASDFLDTSLLYSVTVFIFFFNFRNLSERDCFCLDALGRLLYWVYLTGQCLVPGVKTSLPLSCLRRPGRALESRPGGWLAHLLLPVLFCFFPPCCRVEGSKGRSHLSSHWRGKLYLPAWRGLLGCPHWPWFTFPGEGVPVWICSFRTLGTHRWKRRHHPWPFPSQGPVYWLHWNL